MKRQICYFLIFMFVLTSTFGQNPKLTGFNNYTNWIDKHKDNTVAAKELSNLDEFVLNENGKFSFLIMLPPPETFSVWKIKQDITPSQNFIIKATDNDTGKEWKVYESFCVSGKVNWFEMKPIRGNITLTCTYVDSKTDRSLTYSYIPEKKEIDQELNYYLSKDQINSFAQLNSEMIDVYKNSKTVRLEVFENYDQFRTLEFPFKKTAERLLAFTGLILEDDENIAPDLHIIINVNGHSKYKEANIEGKIVRNVNVAMGVGIEGTILFKGQNKIYYANDFNWEKMFTRFDFDANGNQLYSQISNGYKDVFYENALLKDFGEMLINAFELNPVDFYLYAAGDGIEAISYEALKLLGELGDKNAFDPLVEIYLNDKSIWKRRAAIYALGALQDPRAYTILMEAFKEKDFRIRNNAGKMLFNSLIKMKDSSAFYILTKSLEANYANIRGLAANALGDLNDQRAVKDLINMLDDNEHSVVKNAISTLGKLGDKQVIEPLMSNIDKAENNKNWRKWERNIVLNEIIRVLGDFGDPVAIEYIIPLLKTTNLNKNAAEALVQLTGENLGEKYKDWMNWWNMHRTEFNSNL